MALFLPRRPHIPFRRPPTLKNHLNISFWLQRLHYRINKHYAIIRNMFQNIVYESNFCKSILRKRNSICHTNRWHWFYSSLMFSFYFTFLSLCLYHLPHLFTYFCRSTLSPHFDTYLIHKWRNYPTTLLCSVCFPKLSFSPTSYIHLLRLWWSNGPCGLTKSASLFSFYLRYILVYSIGG